MERDYALILGASQGLLVCSLTVICESIMEWLLRPLPQVPRRNAPDAMGQRYLDALEATP